MVFFDVLYIAAVLLNVYSQHGRAMYFNPDGISHRHDELASSSRDGLSPPLPGQYVSPFPEGNAFPVMHTSASSNEEISNDRRRAGPSVQRSHERVTA